MQLISHYDKNVSTFIEISAANDDMKFCLCDVKST